MPEMDGVSAIRAMSEGGVAARVLVLTTYDTDSDVLAAIEAGATGYLLKDAPRQELLRAVRAAARGEGVLSPAVTSRLLDQVRQPAKEAVSDRELEVLAIDRPRLQQSRGGGPSLHQRGHGQDPPSPHLREAGRQRSGGGCCDRLRPGLAHNRRREPLTGAQMSRVKRPDGRVGSRG